MYRYRDYTCSAKGIETIISDSEAINLMTRWLKAVNPNHYLIGDDKELLSLFCKIFLAEDITCTQVNIRDSKNV